jgi:hypothetical protein
VIPESLVASSRKLKRNDTICRQTGDVLLHIYKDVTEVRMISKILLYSGTTGEFTNKFGERMKKLTSVIQYNKSVKVC